MRPSAGRVNVGTYDMGKLADGEIARLRGTEIGVVLQGAARNLLGYANLHRNIWLAQRRAARTAGITLDDPDRILDLVGLSGQGRARRRSGAGRPAAGRARGRYRGRSRACCWSTSRPASWTRAGRDEVLQALETVNAERGTTIVVVTHDAEVGARLGRAVTIRDGRVGAEGRDGQDFAVVAGDGTSSCRRRCWACTRPAPCSPSTTRTARCRSRSAVRTGRCPGLSWWSRIAGSGGRASLRWARTCQTR